MKRQVLRLLALVLFALVLVGVGTGAGIVLDREVLIAHAAPNTQQTTTGPDFQLMNEAWGIIQRVYVDRPALQSQALTYGALSGMVNALGDTGHSSFLTPEMVTQERSMTDGQYTGIGIEVQQKNGQIVISNPFDNSPAQRAGLRAGDVILKVNGTDLTGQSVDQVVQKVLGAAGTQVTLTIMRPSDGTTRDVTMTREQIILHNVTWQQLPGTTIADLRIVSFSNGVTDDLKKALTDIQNQKMTGIILDLRDNPGGLLDESVGTTSQFISSGDVLEEKNAQGQITHVAVQKGGLATNIPMVVLVNGGTASAAEIVSGALQDAHRAVLVGETTFGTGTVLNQYRLSDGSALLLATSEWLTPNGRTIWHQGITPDVAVTLGATGTPLSPDTLKTMTSAQLQSSGDAQLLRALKLIGGTASVK